MTVPMHLDGPFQLPTEKKAGCMRRIDRPGEHCGVFSDIPGMRIIPRQDWPDLIGTVERRPYVEWIYDQDGVGSCAAEAANQALCIVRHAEGQEPVQFSPWATYNVTSGGRDGGSSVGENLRYLRDVGAVPMDLWPRSKGWRTRVPGEILQEEAIKYRLQEYWEVETVEELGTALLLGFPVTFGWSGHSCVFTELTSTTQARYANSWHESWGDNGFGLLSLNRINWGYGAYAFRAATHAAG